MNVAVVIAVTLACIAWSLWIRRVTWSCRWEVAATLNIALQGAAVALMSPPASETLGPVLHRLTGMWNLEDYIAHDGYVVAASAIVYNALGRLQTDAAMQRSFQQYVERPATLCIPLLLATFWVGNGSTEYRADFFQVPTDFWLGLYWVVLCSTLIYLLGYGMRAMLILRKDPRSRRVANVYLAASISGVIACGIRILTACVPVLQPYENGKLVWIFACACGAAFALAAGNSWRSKTRWLSPSSR